ncbi:MAG: Holliday junction branch migration protein RuvA [Salinivirgaceae bacterium]|jgi:Holliday junction DNA helicase RuvA|nr:Holliday junction branch migration protein RuvA [Salinivirgaceae bacterium]
MFEYIKGTLTVAAPTHCVVEAAGVGYLLNISLTTFETLKEGSEVRLLVHPIYREDNQQLFGFTTPEERDLFRHLIGVSGVGANTARMMLSSMQPAELINAIATEQVKALKTIKGIGLRTAERIVVDLKDKIKQPEGAGEIFASKDNTTQDEALSALMMLGFPKKPAEKVIVQILKAEAGLTVEAIIKRALKQL